MKFLINFCALVCLLAMSTTELPAQLRVGNSGNVGIGASSNSNYRLFVANSREHSSLRINSTSNSSGTRVGIYNYLRSAGRGARFGVYNYLHDNSALSTSNATAYGLYNSMSISTRGRSIGFGNSILNTNADANDVIFGFYSVVHAGTTGAAKMYGVFSDVQGADNYAGYFSGRVHINGSFTQTSDASLKTNSNEVADAISILKRLNPQSYSFKKGNRFGYNPEQTHYGFMAQDVESILPSIVSDIHHPAVYNQEEEPATKTDENGDLIIDDPEAESKAATVKHPAETLKAIRYLDLIAILTQAIKDQQEQIEDQVSDYEDLEGELFDLKTEMKQYREVLSRLADCAGCVSADNIPVEDNRQVTPVGIQLFPNPANESFTVQHSNDAGFGTRLYSADGKLVLELPFAIGSKRIDTSALSAGSYIVEVFDAANKTVEKQIVVVAH